MRDDRQAEILFQCFHSDNPGGLQTDGPTCINYTSADEKTGKGERAETDVSFDRPYGTNTGRYTQPALIGSGECMWNFPSPNGWSSMVRCEL